MAPGHPPSTMLELEVLNEGKSTMVSVASDGTVDDLKAEIAAAEGTEFENQKLKFRGKRMQDGQLLSVYRVASGQTIALQAWVFKEAPLLDFFFTAVCALEFGYGWWLVFQDRAADLAEPATQVRAALLLLLLVVLLLLLLAAAGCW